MGIVKDEELLKVLGNEIVQVGIIVKDMAKVRQGMLDLFGLEPDSEGDVVYKKVLYRGQTHDAPVRNAFYNYFNIQFEFLEPIGSEDTIWRDYLNMGQYSLHHLRWNVKDNDEVTRLMAEKGIGIWMEGESLVTPGNKFTYYDSLDKVGFIIEAVTA
ncbi:MAG: VOC family protein [Eggerthellaceae bacterium]|jgi:hypothetical protein